MSPLISIIIPSYNRKTLLGRALASVAAQTWRPLEVVIVDDGSTDGTADTIPAHRADLARHGIGLHFLSQPNGGPAKARNTGFAQSHGSLITFLDSDDMWQPTFAHSLAALLDRYPTAGLAFGGYMAMDADEKILGLRPSGLPAEPREGLLEKPFQRIVNHMPFGTPCVMVRRTVLESLGAFDTTYRIGEDWDLWFRIALEHDFAYTVEGLTLCRDHPDNMLKTDSRAMMDRVRLDLKYVELVTDRQAKAALEQRIREEIVLLQEQLLREGRRANGSRSLLENPFAPHTIRYRLGALMGRQPIFVGRAYAALIRAVGGLQRTARGYV